MYCVWYIVRAVYYQHINLLCEVKNPNVANNGYVSLWVVHFGPMSLGEMALVPEAK